MRVTIIADDSAVYVEEQALVVDLSGLDEDIHAVQWYGTVGEIEYKYDAVANTKKPNVRISGFLPFQIFVDRWTIEAQKVPAPSSSTAAVPASSGVTVIE